MSFVVKNIKDILFTVLLAGTLLMWSSSYTAIRVALHSFSPESLALFRFLIASIFLLIYCGFKKISLPALKDLPVIFLTGFFGVTLYHLALNAGETSVNAGSASMIVNTYPIFVAILSTIFLKEYVNLSKWAGILISFAGIALIAIGESGGINISPGIIFILVAAIGNSLYDVIQKHLLNKYTPLELTSYFIWAGTLLLFFFGIDLIQDLPTATPSAILSALYLGIFPSAIGYLVWSKALSRNPLTKIAPLFYTLPVFAVLIAFVVLGEIPATTSIIGGLIIIIGVILVNFSKQLKWGISEVYTHLTSEIESN